MEEGAVAAGSHGPVEPPLPPPGSAPRLQEAPLPVLEPLRLDEAVPPALAPRRPRPAPPVTRRGATRPEWRPAPAAGPEVCGAGRRAGRGLGGRREARSRPCRGGGRGAEGGGGSRSEAGARAGAWRSPAKGPGSGRGIRCGGRGVAESGAGDRATGWGPESSLRRRKGVGTGKSRDRAK